MRSGVASFVLDHPAAAGFALLDRARLPMIALGVLGGWLLYRLVTILHGRTAAMLALALYAGTPEITGHMVIVTTDAPMATFGLGAVLMALKLRRRFTSWCCTWLAVHLTAAHMTKFNAVVLWPMVLVILVFPGPGRLGLSRVLQTAAHGVAATAALALVVCQGPAPSRSVPPASGTHSRATWRTPRSSRCSPSPSPRCQAVSRWSFSGAGRCSRSSRRGRPRSIPTSSPPPTPSFPRSSFDAARARIARMSGWTITAADRDEGILTARVTTRPFGFQADVTVNIRRADGVTLVSVRSETVSANKEWADFGQNARNVRRFVKEFRGKMGEEPKAEARRP